MPACDATGPNASRPSGGLLWILGHPTFFMFNTTSVYWTSGHGCHLAQKKVSPIEIEKTLRYSGGLKTWGSTVIQAST